MLRVITLAAAVLLALSACSPEPVHPAAGPTSATAPAARAAAKPATPSKPKVDLAHIRAKDVFGDLTTVDACTMTSVADLPAEYHKHGTPSTWLAYRIDDCEIDMMFASRHRGSVTFGELAAPGTTRTRILVHYGEDVGGGLHVLRGDSGNGYCFSYLVFADDISILIDAETIDGATKTELCKAGRAVATNLVSRLRSGADVGHRVVRRSSLHHQDACTYLSASAARSVPGLGGVRKVDDFPAHHTCFYKDNNDNGQWVTVDFVVLAGDLSSFTHSTKSTVAGRKTATRRTAIDDRYTKCEVVTTYTEASKAKLSAEFVEGVSVSVQRAGQAGALCSDTTVLAAKIWSKLPTA